MALKVLHVIGGGEFGGAERHILNLAAAVDPAAVEITVCCLFSEPFARMAGEAGLDAVAVPMRHKADFGVAQELAYLVRQRGFDLVHTHGVRASLVGRLASRQTGGRKVVTTVHSLLEKDYHGLLSRLVNSWAERFSRGLTDRFIAVSEELKKQLVERGVPADRIAVIYNGIVLEEFVPPADRDAARSDLNLDPAAPLVGIVGRLHAVKGHGYFLEAARMVLQQLPETRFLVVGEGPCRPELEKMATKLGLAGQVTFTGFVDDVLPAMAALDVLVIPSLWEGFGLTAVEAMALGVPVVAADVGGLPEVVLHGETGLLTPPADPETLARNIVWILEHPEEAAEMSGKGREIVRQKFTAALMARRTEELYRRVAGEVGVPDR